jgi:hypothetical protein
MQCIAGVDGVTRCMARCEADDRICADGAVCLESPSDGRLCWFGGRTLIREACTSPLECEPGTVCTAREGGSVCIQGCEVGDDRPCDDDEVCEAVQGGAPTEGACAEVPDAGAGDAGAPDAALTTP